MIVPYFNVKIEDHYLLLIVLGIVVVLLSVFKKDLHHTSQGSDKTQDSKELAVQAVSSLAAAASSPTAISPEAVAPVANIAIASTTTPAGAQAIQALANQAVSPEAGDPKKVHQATAVAVQSM